MQLITRTAWGARPPRNGHAPVASTQGTKIHYLGTEYTAAGHSTCAGYMRKLQNTQMDTGERWADFAYNYAVCEHGYVFEGRGVHAQNAANGNTTLNRSHYAVLAFVGSKGHTKPTTAQVQGIKDAIAHLRSTGGAGRQIRGHRDGYNTACPGSVLYKLVTTGALEPGTAAPDPGTPQPFPGADWFTKQPRSPIITAMGERLVAEDCSAYRTGPGPQWTGADRASYAKWQRKLGYRGMDADGWPGKTSWERLRVPRG
ncbi:N-acetylmuramoyl-L-alanine amidase [Streptomyces sp. TRM66268-LWL]|uniref:N-acetylmuramoyl-L-alanine amidase n=1 Tax=Streptomyces polyasparticus TaxID=2767826 RepID=A0ABR7SXX1_9ACTN|nr:peptidoglycan-binding protein [Streptomyces polyasparticus]MBC9719515.1 N-acetylmuramoyl-L-alanine amidase [Streptomyces polyasparticus]